MLAQDQSSLAKRGGLEADVSSGANLYPPAPGQKREKNKNQSKKKKELIRTILGKPIFIKHSL